MPSVCIIYGFGEGPKISKKLVRELKNDSYIITKDPAKADILIAHSGGYLMIPKNISCQTLLLVAPANGYNGKSILWAQAKKVFVDIRYCQQNKLLTSWLGKSLWNIAYTVSKSRNYRMILEGKRLGKDLPNFNANKIGIILQRDDPWSWYIDRDKILNSKKYSTLVSHPGIHDEIWMHPKDYVAILQYLHETELLVNPKQR